MMNDIYEVIEKIRQRTGMYLPVESLSRLESFLHGYDCALIEHGIKDDEAATLFPLPFSFFSEYVSRFFDYSESTSGWCNIILEHSNFDEQRGFFTFYELFDKFSKITAKSYEKIKLTNENIIFHCTDKQAPRRVVGPDFNEEEPLYKSPEETYCIELTNNAGYLILINTAANYVLEFQICETKQQIDEYLSMCFGRLPDWEEAATGSIALDKEIVLW